MAVRGRAQGPPLRQRYAFNPKKKPQRPRWGSESNRSLRRVLGIYAGCVAIRLAGARAQGPVENRADPIRDDAAPTQQTVSADVSVIRAGSKSGAGSADREGGRESNLGQHF